MPDERNIEQILAYLREQSGRYDLELLRGQLLATGYDPADVAAAIERLRATPIEPAQAPPSATPPVAQPTVPALAQPAQAPPASQSAPPSVAPAAGASDDTALAELVAYLEQHGRKINLYSLRKQLIEAGHPPALVDEAVRRAEPSTKSTWARAWLIGLPLALVNLFVIPGLSSFIGDIFDIDWWWLLPIVALVAELIAGLLLRSGPRAVLGRALITGLIYTAVIFGALAILGLVILGVCIVILQALSGG